MQALNGFDPSKQVIRADFCGVGLLIIGDLGLSVASNTPVLDAAKQLVNMGFDPRTTLCCFRGGRLALTVTNIGDAAQLEISGDGVSFRRRRVPRLATAIATLQAAE